jgi:hypothetical protein
MGLLKLMQFQMPDVALCIADHMHCSFSTTEVMTWHWTNLSCNVSECDPELCELPAPAADD